MGFSDDFVDPAPWYFRTISSWLKLFETAGLRLVAITIPAALDQSPRDDWRGATTGGAHSSPATACRLAVAPGTG